jgi:hypothetical protein
VRAIRANSSQKLIQSRRDSFPPGLFSSSCCFLFLVVISDVQAVDPRDPFHPFLRSRWRVLQLLFGPLLGSGYYHLLSGLRFLLTFRRCGLTSPRSQCPPGTLSARPACSSHHVVSRLARACARRAAHAPRARRRDSDPPVREPTRPPTTTTTSSRSPGSSPASWTGRVRPAPSRLRWVIVHVHVHGACVALRA